jgi:hypothetical protein
MRLTVKGLVNLLSFNHGEKGDSRCFGPLAQSGIHDLPIISSLSCRLDEIPRMGDD